MSEAADSFPAVIQSVPRESTLKVSNSTSLSSGVVCGLKMTKRVPSNRARPPLRVPTQRYPSGVCARQLTEFCGRPWDRQQQPDQRTEPHRAGKQAPPRDHDKTLSAIPPLERVQSRQPTPCLGALHYYPSY